MDLYEAMRTTFAAREFTGDPLPDDVLYRILDNARFAPSGGNRQGARVVVVRAQETRRELARLVLPGARRYIAQRTAGENPWNSITPCGVDAQTIARTEVPRSMTQPLLDAAVVLVVCVDLRVVASVDKELPRVGVVRLFRASRESARPTPELTPPSPPRSDGLMAAGSCQSMSKKDCSR